MDIDNDQIPDVVSIPTSATKMNKKNFLGAMQWSFHTKWIGCK